ncbi:M4 family metallopeptidase [Pseudochryseolinea flava]|nr:M4 family metallopeptidase [Pseudochryseolinea flava]
MCKKFIPLILITLLLAGETFSQQILSTAVNAKSLSTGNQAPAKIHYANTNEPPRAIEFEDGAVTTASFMGNINRYFAIPNAFTFSEVESSTDKIGMNHYALQQYYQGIPVEGLGYRVHTRGGFVRSANGKGVKHLDVNTETIISEQQAFHTAITLLNTKDTIFRQAKKLITSKDFTYQPGSFSVVFQFDIRVSLVEHWRMSIDARTGQLVNKVSLVNSCTHDPKPKPTPLPYVVGTGLTNYYGKQNIRIEQIDENHTALSGKTEHGGIISTYSYNNRSLFLLLMGIPVPVSSITSTNTTYNLAYQKPAVSVQWAAEKTYEYYFKKHNRNSFDNQGAAIMSYVNVDVNLNNAFWTGELLAFGDGSNNNPLVELDIVGHEFTHGVTQYEARLQYLYEPGALNESFSDILGKAIEFDAFGDTATWQLGRHYRSGGLRDFVNPNSKNQPDTYEGDLWYTGYDDNGGVHYNSGVQNYWFYLLCKGGSGVNDHDFSYAVNPIGMDAAVNIAYRNLTDYLGNTSDYLDARIGSMLAAADLYGKNSTEYQEVDKAWDAVGVIDEPIIKSLEVYDITATTVKLRGNFIPRADTASYHFEYGTTPALGSSTQEYPYDGKVEGIITGLQSNTKYYVSLVASNKNGNTISTLTFTTLPLTPLVRIKRTVDVTETTAVLHGAVNPNSLFTSFRFEYGPTSALGMVTPTYPLSDTTEFVNASAPIENLQPRKTYYYKLIATNAHSSAATGIVTFYTAVKPVINSFAPMKADIKTAVTITGENFNPTPTKNIVSFGATRAKVLQASSTELKVEVPPGASLAPVSIVDEESGLRAQSVHYFTPTFTGDFKIDNMQLRVGNNEYIYQTIVEDMDGDKKPDIVTRNYLGFSIFLNVNQGGDITEQSFVRSLFNGTSTPGELSLVDFDGNGLKDVVGRFENGLRIYPNQSAPGYIFFGAPVDVPSTIKLNNAAFGDFDQDGHIDIVGSTSLEYQKTHVIAIRNENPKGQLSAANFEHRYQILVPYAISDILVNDMDNNGSSDMLVATDDEVSFLLMKNMSTGGSFQFDTIRADDPHRKHMVDYISCDFNDDLWKDVASHTVLQEGVMTILENRQSPNMLFTTPTVMLSDPRADVEPADINGDGKIDLIAGSLRRDFSILVNKLYPGEPITTNAFENLGTIGLTVANNAYTYISVNDLNGDGRPEIITNYDYYYGPHDGYQMEIWQNSTEDCLDAANVRIETYQNSAKIILPPNTTFEDFEIDYSHEETDQWYRVYSTTLYSLYAGYQYKLRVRTKCHLAYTAYHYTSFSTECLDATSFSLGTITANSVSLNTNNIYAYDIQYSLAGKKQWVQHSGYQIFNLAPGTEYDVRYRGNCSPYTQFKYLTFTTSCPSLTTIEISELNYNSAVAIPKRNFTGSVLLEYSEGNENWITIDASGTMYLLIPGKRYTVRGKFTCANDAAYTTVSFTTPCPSVSNLHVNDITPFTATASWFDQSQTNSYTITYKNNFTGKTSSLETTSTSVTLTDLTPGTAYSLSVAPHCLGQQSFTNLSFTTVCFSPETLTATAITHTAAKLAWHDDFGGSPYIVRYAATGSDEWIMNTTAATSMSLSDLRPGTSYDIRVHIECPSVTPPFASLRIKTALYDETTISPNPTTGVFTIYPASSLIGNQFVMYDNVGRIVARGILTDYTLDLSNYLPGMYSLKIDGEKLMRVVKY